MAHDLDDDTTQGDAQLEAELWQALQDLETLGQEDPSAALAMFAELPDAVRSLGDFQLVQASLLRSSGDLAAATSVLEALIEADPEDSDAHHLLGDVLEESADFQRALPHFLETLRLDTLASKERFPTEIEAELDVTLEHLQHVVEELPGEWQARLKGVPLLVQPLPSEDMVRGGLDPRALGLFEGPMHVDTQGIDQAPLPTRIVLFAENLALDFPDADDFREQVRVTVLHELGHYFGLDEDDMVRLGLD